MKTYIQVLTLLFLFSACKSESKNEVKEENSVDVNIVESSADTTNIIEKKLSKFVDERTYSNGLSIQWTKKGKGAKIGFGDVISIDYKVELEDGTVVDGNHLLNKEEMPFVVGFQMQTEGWELALKEMNVGDEAKIVIPSKLARGEKGIKGLIPPNALNILSLKIKSKLVADKAVSGAKIYLLEENKKNNVLFDKTNKIKFHCMISTPEFPLYHNTFRTNKVEEMTFQSKGFRDAFKEAMLGAKKADRMFILVEGDENAKGIDQINNQPLFYNLFVTEVQ